ncbi:MAG: DUF5916 domain-containing protein [Gemmatimonadota bacterium]
MTGRFPLPVRLRPSARAESQSGPVPRRGLVPAAAAVLAAFVATAPADAAAQERLIPRLDGPVVVDGHVDDAAWASIPPLPMTMFEPEFGGEITRPSVVRVAHDGEYLYAAGEFADDDRVRANSLVRDHYADDDMFNLVIDSFDDERSAFWFLVTPRGTRVDGTITDDAEGDSWNHPEFDNYWNAAAVVHDGGGWSAELRIPFSSLRFRQVDGEAVMGLIAGRLIPRHQERHTFPAIRPGPAVAQFKPSLAAKVRIEGIEAARPVHVVPYLLGGFTDAFDPSDPSGRGWNDFGEIGGDVKVALGRSLTLDLTVNTDFAQTEVDDARVNLTRFDLFYPEKRRFFLERSGVFDFGDGSEHRLFHTRMIGLSDDGRAERIYGGSRLAGRVGEWDLGLVTMQTARADADGTENSTVARVRRTVLNPNSALGGILTTRTAIGGELVAAGGIDGSVRLFGSSYLEWDIAAVAGTGRRFDDDRLNARVSLERRDRSGLAYDLEVVRVGERYRPPLGFILRNGTTGYRATIRHGEFGGRVLQERAVLLEAAGRRRHADGALESGDLALGWTGVRRGGGSLTAGVRLSREDLLEPFPLSAAAVVPAGEYRFIGGDLQLATPPGGRIRTVAVVDGGGFFDGRRITVALRPQWNPSPHVEISGELESNAVTFPDRDQSYRADIVRLRARVSMDAHASLHGVVQYDGATDAVGTNVRLRYNFREGRDLYVVYTEGRPALAPTGGGGGGDGPAARDRRLVVKYTHAIVR